MSASRRPRFALRKVRDGRVRISGRDFAPSDQWKPYDGRLDGQVMAFGLYYTDAGFDVKGVCLWGTEAMYRCGPDADEFHRLYEANPSFVDGGYPWMFWPLVSP